MTTYLNNYLDPIYQTSLTDYYNSIVRIAQSGYYGTGTLLYDGKSILTAAHIFEKSNKDNITVYFDSPTGTLSYDATVTIHENYDEINVNSDIAIVTLEERALPDYQRHDIYRDDNEIGNIFTMVGYGSCGTGYMGESIDLDDVFKLKTQNRFDTDFNAIKNESDVLIAWDPLEDSILAADFDSGLYRYDALGNILGIDDLGLYEKEGMIASGDSGGPAFIGDLVAGVASYITSFKETDINSELDSSFGEIGAWQRVSYYSEWIDKIIRSAYEDAPTSMNEVKTTIVESDNETVYTYFLLEYVSDRSKIDDNITLEYATKDGTAFAGEDYIETSGVITLYTDESSVVIPVEIIGDDKIENDETFYLEVTNPSHGNFGEDIITLSAVRTIIDDDFLI